MAAEETAEELKSTVEKLKSDLALLSQSSEYDENVDLQVRKIAKKVSLPPIILTLKYYDECDLNIQYYSNVALLFHRYLLKT